MKSKTRRTIRDLEWKSIMKIAFLTGFLFLIGKVIGQYLVAIHQERMTVEEMEIVGIGFMMLYFTLSWIVMTPIVTWKETNQGGKEMKSKTRRTIRDLEWKSIMKIVFLTGFLFLIGKVIGQYLVAIHQERMTVEEMELVGIGFMMLFFTLSWITMTPIITWKKSKENPSSPEHATS